MVDNNMSHHSIRDELTEYESDWSIYFIDAMFVFFFQAEDGIRDDLVTGVQTCALPIYLPALAQQLEQPFKFALAKGRGRFVCKLKLERLASTGEAQDEDLDDLFAEEKAQAQSRVARPARSEERRVGKECRSRWSPDQLK